MASHRIVSTVLISLGALLLSTGCTRSTGEPPRTVAAAPATDEQVTIDRAAFALERMRTNPNFYGMEAYLHNARAVMIFPKVYRAGFLIGGAGGNGILVTRDARGHWSAPAFYSLGAGTAGLQIGYEEASVVLVFMTDRALRSAVRGGLTLGADASLSVGSIGNPGASAATNTGRDIYQFVDAGGLFVGASLDGTYVSAREGKNRDFYGPTANTESIVMGRHFDRPETTVLKRALVRAS